MKLFSKLILLVTSVVSIALLVSSFFVSQYVESREKQVIQERISALAKIVATNETIEQALEQQDMTGTIQHIAKDMMISSGVDFIVVMDTNFIRYSHPTEDIIGQTFSNVEDAGQTLTIGDHFSQQIGTFGDGLRYFTTIQNDFGDIIGIVCVGYKQTTVSTHIKNAQKTLLPAMFIGLGVGVIFAYMFAKRLKKIMLNLEPEEIAQMVIAKQSISDQIVEGIIAIDLNRQVIFVNKSAKNLLTYVGQGASLEVGNYMTPFLYDLLFDRVHQQQTSSHDERIVIDTMEFIVNANAIYVDEALYGFVATLRDESYMKQLITHLSSTEKYNDVLRSQNHHFMNKIHVLQGLIELKHYEEAEKYIRYLKTDYHTKIGQIADNIKVPALIGLLLGKIEEAAQLNIQLQIDPESHLFNDNSYDTLYHDLTIILGVLIDNAIEAANDDSPRQIQVYLSMNEEEQVVICRVQDNGIGISEEIKSEIFKRGFSSKGDNRGYGLEAVALLVKQYQGMIDVVSEVGKGTNITVELMMIKETK